MGFFVASHPAGVEPSVANTRFSKTFRLQSKAEEEAAAQRAAGLEAVVLEGRAPRLAAARCRRRLERAS